VTRSRSAGNADPEASVPPRICLRSSPASTFEDFGTTMGESLSADTLPLGGLGRRLHERILSSYY